MGRGFHVVTLCTLSRDVMQCYVIDTRSIAVHALIGMGVRIMCYLKSREIAAAHYRGVFRCCQSSLFLSISSSSIRKLMRST